MLCHDYGVTVGQELLARQQNTIKNTNNEFKLVQLNKVVFLNGGLFPESHRPVLLQTMLTLPILGPLIAFLTSSLSFKRTFSKIFGVNAKPSTVELNHFWGLINLQKGKMRFPELITYMSQRRIHRDRWVNALVNAKIPLLFINGLDDPISGAHMVRRYKEIVPNPNVIELQGIGHYPQWEDPEAICHNL